MQMPQITLDTTAVENTFDTVGQSMMQLARTQDQTDNYNNTSNRDKLTYKLIQEPYTNWQLQLIKEILTTYLPAFLYMMGVIEKDSFLGLNA